jgi:hypothetical protein
MSDADRIHSKDEIVRILKSGETSNAEVSSSALSLDLEVVRAEGTLLVLGPKNKLDTAALASFNSGAIALGKPIEIVFGLVDGQYAIRDEVRDFTTMTFSVDAGAGLLRLQRRKDFRVAIARGSMRFIWNAGKASSISLDLIDLSAGGLRLLWPSTAGAIPRVGEKLGGDLMLKVGPSAESIAVTVSFVKDNGAYAPLKPELGEALSFRFEGLSQDDARAVLFACLGVYRNRYGSS